MLDQSSEPDALEALDEQPHGAVRRPRELVDHAHGADPVEVVGPGGSAPRSRWATSARSRLPRMTSSTSRTRARLADHQRDRGQREDDRVPQRQDRQRVGDREVVGVAGGLAAISGCPPRLGSVMRSSPRS